MKNDSWWAKDFKDFGQHEVEVTPAEDGRAMGYEMTDEYEIMHTDFDTDFMTQAKEFAQMCVNKKRRRQFLEKITTIPDGKLEWARASLKVDYPTKDPEIMMLKEGWGYRGQEQHKIMKRRYKSYVDAL